MKVEDDREGWQFNGRNDLKPPTKFRDLIHAARGAGPPNSRQRIYALIECLIRGTLSYTGFPALQHSQTHPDDAHAHPRRDRRRVSTKKGTNC